MSKWSKEDTQKFAVKNGTLYQVIGYCASPTLIFENLKTGEQESYSVEAPLIEEFIKMVPEEK